MSTQFVLNIVTVLCFLTFHVLVAKEVLRVVRRKNPVRYRHMGILLGALIVLLDLPIAYLLILYKEYHPLVADQIMHAVTIPFLVLHANALILGGILLVRQYIFLPVALRVKNLRNRMVSEMIGIEGVESVIQQNDDQMKLFSWKEREVDEDEEPFVLGRRGFIRTSALALTGVVAGGTVVSAAGDLHEYQIERPVIKIPGLPEGFKGMRIALVGDVHSSVFMTREDMERYVKVINGLNADVIFIVGDFVNSKLHEVYPLGEAFSGLEAPMGVYGVTGNHDYYTNELEAVTYEIEQAGITLLRNGNLPLERNGERIWLTGMDDGDIYEVRPYIEGGKTEEQKIEEMLRGIPNDATKIFLCHKPYPFEEYSQLGMDLMLSGHTHGGQVVIAQMDSINLSFAALASKYISGLYKSRSRPSSQLYVTRGLGTVGVPFRLNCPPEVTYITLV